jgi:hypothetical protein
MKSVVICGSQRYKKEIIEFAKQLEHLGVPLVLIPDFRWTRDRMLSAHEAERLKSKRYRARLPGVVRGHLHKILKADVCFVYNRKGYIGVNTTLEIGAAAALNKFIFALEPDKSEPCRDILFDKIVSTPEELVEYLKD